MNGAATESTEAGNLREGFAQFVHAAKELESSYAALKLRAESVDRQLQESNRALALSLAEREAMFAALPIGMVATRADGTLGTCNREASRLLEIACEAGVQLAEQPAGEYAIGELCVRVQRVALEDGEMVLLEDRSQLEQLEAKVQRLDRLAGLSELALGVAHEVKNPLTGVLGFASMLERSDSPDAMKRYAGKIVDGVRAVDEIVKSLLRFARPVDRPARTAALEDVVRRCMVSAHVGAARWRLTAPREVLRQVVDVDALSSVLANLVRNACEAKVDAELALTARRIDGVLEIEFVDDGPGVARDVAGKVFEPFASTKQQGTGLGLALGARVLSFLGGDLRLMNPGECGARFLLRLPLAVASAVDAAGADRAPWSKEGGA
ncbi:MAG: PAS domain-containing sensor histidine kinase [Planctomycetota bacterium]